MPPKLDRDLIKEIYRNIPKAEGYYNRRLFPEYWPHDKNDGKYYPMEKMLLVCKSYHNNLWYEYYKTEPIEDGWLMCFMHETQNAYIFYKQIMPFFKKFLKSEGFLKFMEDLEIYPKYMDKQSYDLI